MNFIGRWFGALGLCCIVVGGTATTHAADRGGILSNSDASEVAPNDEGAGSGPSILDENVRTASGTSLLESTSNWLDESAGGCCCNQSDWILSGGAVFLHRSRPDPSAIATPPTGTPGTLISGSNFGFNWNAGPLVSIARRTASGRIFEARYFNDRDATASYDLNNINTFRIAGIGVTILGSGSLSSSYLTQLDSTEFNLLEPINDRLSLIAGFRAVQLHDQLNVAISSPGIFTKWNENNRLYGAQTGVNLNLFEPGRALQFNGSLKAGVYANTAFNAFTSNIVSGATSSASSTAFVGEVNFTASYQITKRLSARAGYMVVWLDGLSLADRAAARTTQAAGGSVSPTNLHGDLFYNGALASLDYVW